MRVASIAVGLALVLSALALGCSPQLGSLRLRVVDSATGGETPARVELLGADGEPHVPPDALPVAQECLVAPLPGWSRPFTHGREIWNPYTRTTQFYVDGTATVELPPGRYRVRVYKGNEFSVSQHVVEVREGGRTELVAELERWIDPAREGWYGADDHLHISRLSPDSNAWLAQWMQAEGLHVANLLQMGTVEQFGVTPQYRFGAAGTFRTRETLLLPGQEHPRTHLLGHTITLGAAEPINLRDTYILYDGFWQASRRLGGVSGFAHWGTGPARDGLALNAPTGGIRFVEVLQLETPYYDVWYELLNLGFLVAPTAGTDFPCLPSLPGRERFYARVDGELGRVSWLEAVRRGRTFVTNGPILELEVEGAGPGGELRLDGPGTVHVRGLARFDPARDHLDALELVRNGEVTDVMTLPAGPGRLQIEVDVPVERSAWFALRASGGKLDEAPYAPFFELPVWAELAFTKYIAGGGGEELQAARPETSNRPTSAHTAAVHVTVKGSGPLAGGERRRVLGREWLARLDALEDRLSDDRIAEIPIWDWIPYSDGVSEAHLRRHRPALLEAIARARGFYAGLETSGE
jgi:hypothetical protein